MLFLGLGQNRGSRGKAVPWQSNGAEVAACSGSSNGACPGQGEVRTHYWGAPGARQAAWVERGGAESGDSTSGGGAQLGRSNGSDGGYEMEAAMEGKRWCAHRAAHGGRRWG